MTTQTGWYARPVSFVADLNRSIRFYAEMPGFVKMWHEGGGTGTVCQVNRGSCEIILCEHGTRRDKARLFVVRLAQRWQHSLQSRHIATRPPLKGLATRHASGDLGDL